MATLLARALLALFLLFITPLSLAAPPAGLNAADWSAIQAQLPTNTPYQARLVADGWQARNPAHGFRLHFARDGSTTLQSGAARISLQLQAVGYGRVMQPLRQPEAQQARGGRVDIRWNGQLREWWVNNADGVEQWLELAQAPGRRPWPDAPLRVELQLHSNLQASLAGEGQARHLLLQGAGQRIHFRKLRVWDADGQALPARMLLNPQADGAAVLAYEIDERKARYPLTIDPAFVQEAYIKASNTGAFDQFGWSVAVDGNAVAVGAPYEDGSGDSLSNSGAVYVFERDTNGDWQQAAYLKASNALNNDRFGRSVALSGNTLVVGAIGVDDPANNSGAVYVFVRDSNGNWSQQAILQADNAGDSDNFGWSVAVSGDTVVVGALNEASSATGVVNGSSSGSAGSDDSATEAGAAYVFVRDSNGNWSQQAYLKASNTEAYDNFGSAVAVDGNTLVVGAIYESSNFTGVTAGQNPDTAGDNNLAGASGAAYVFVRDGNVNWRQQAYLKASNTDAGDNFGYSVAISGNRVLVGARFEDSAASGINGDDNDNTAAQAGAAYVFVRDGNGNWSQEAYLKASNTGADDSFGVSVALSGNLAVVGAEWEDSSSTGIDGNQADNGLYNPGAAYVFVHDGQGNWRQQVYLKASNTGLQDYFGGAVATDGTLVLVGADSEDSNATGVNGNQGDNSSGSSGAAYLFFSLGELFSDGFE